MQHVAKRAGKEKLAAIAVSPSHTGAKKVWGARAMDRRLSNHDKICRLVATSRTLSRAS
jgi:hypothetical protein